MPVISMEELNLLHSTICQALSEPKRIQILYALYGQPRHVTTLAEDLDTPQSTISRHLAVLRQRGLVMAERDGPSVTYRLADDTIIQVLDTMRGLLRSILERQSNALEN